MIYHADANQLLGLVNQLSDSLSRVMLVGHNPTMTDFAYFLTGNPIGPMPTASVCVVSFALEHWLAVDQRSGECLWFDYPRRSNS